MKFVLFLLICLSNVVVASEQPGRYILSFTNYESKICKNEKCSDFSNSSKKKKRMITGEEMKSIAKDYIFDWLDHLVSNNLIIVGACNT